MFDRIVRLSIGNPVFVNLLFIVICVAGFMSAMRLPVEQFPEVSLDQVAVVVRYPGASASDVEELITRPIEEAVEEVEDVKEMTSTSSEGSSRVFLTFLAGTDIDTARSNVEKAVATVEDLPEDAEAPDVVEVRFLLPVVSLGIKGTTSDRKTIERLRDALRDIPGVASVETSGLAERKVFVELLPERMVGLGVAPDDVVAAIRDTHVSLPAGSVETRGTEILVKTEGRIEGAADVAAVLLPGTDGLRVGDVARVEDRPEERVTDFYVDGVPAVKLTVNREDGADPVGIRNEIVERLPEFAAMLPAGLDLVVADDYTRVIRDRLEVVGVNAISGAFLVILVLYVMSGPRQAALAVWGMPVSYLFATWMMGVSGTSLNVVSSFGLLIATGIIVDDAIVVIENVQRLLEEGKDRLTATIEGTKEVLLPVTVAVATTMFAFMPLAMVGGTMGRVMKILPYVVIFCLLGSLLEAIFILPGHIYEYGGVGDEHARPARIARRMQRIYRPIVTWTTRHRKLTVLLALLGFLAALATAATMKRQVGAPGKPFELQIFYELPPGTDKARTRAMGERIIADVAAALPDGAVRTTTLRVGSTMDRRTGRDETGTNVASIRWEFELTDAFLEAYPAMVRSLRTFLATTPEIVSHSVAEAQAGPPAGAGITARIRGRDIRVVNEAVYELENALRKWPGVSDVRNDYGAGRETYRIRVDDDRAARYGLTRGGVARAVRTAIDGTVADEVSLDEDPVEIVVRYAGADRSDARTLRDLLLPRPGGGFVRLDEVARLERTREVGLIRREDGLRTVSVLGEVDGERITSVEAAARIQALWDERFRERFPDLELAFGGEADEFSESLNDLPSAFALAVALIYTALALQFRSYVQPGIIISAVPFGVTGAIFGLFAMGFPLSVFALFGIVALSGICVNDSLVMVDFINKLRDGGMPAAEAAVEGAIMRLRPIVSTTLTTVLGLLPLAVGLGGQDLILAPMAVSIAAGLGVATSLILLVVPALYLVVEDVRGAVRRRFGRT
ncbi:MAG: efflux RND transporter permease subunit [Deltaproteobacteria bacterium]|nr:MAG: efflux RND transporter permease subunit [Deltaproteobacteria bacterium]